MADEQEHAASPMKKVSSWQNLRAAIHAAPSVNPRVIALSSLSVLCAAVLYYRHINPILLDCVIALIDRVGYFKYGGRDPFIEAVKFYLQEHPMASTLLGSFLFAGSFTIGLAVALLCRRARRGRSGEWDIAVAAAATLGFFVYACFFWTFVVPWLGRWAPEMVGLSLHEATDTFRFAAGTSGVHTVGFFAAHILHLVLERQAVKSLEDKARGAIDDDGDEVSTASEEAPPKVVFAALARDPLLWTVLALVFVGSARRKLPPLLLLGTTLSLVLGTLFEYVALFVVMCLGDFCLYCMIAYGWSLIFEGIHFASYQKRKKAALQHAKEQWHGNFLNYVFLIAVWKGHIGKHIYTDITAYPLWYTMLTIPVYYFCVDTVFYWLHVAAHHPRWYKSSHSYHHIFRPPTCWAVRASHFLDAALENIAFTSVLVTIPFYLPIAIACLVSNAVWVTYLHTGSDHAFPGLAGALHHKLHHYYGENSCNYALYFQFWDRLMGTYRETTGTLNRTGSFSTASTPTPRTPGGSLDKCAANPLDFLFGKSVTPASPAVKDDVKSQ